MKHATSWKTPARAVIFVFIFLIAGLAPLAMSGKINDLVRRPPSEHTPETGQDLLDNALRTLTGLLDEATEPLTPVRPLFPAEPQVPATILYDHLEEDPIWRVGGWGEWAQAGEGGYGWRLDVNAATEGTARGYRFWNPSDGFYPVFAGKNLDAYLVSPRISLRSVPADADPADTGRVPNPQQDLERPIADRDGSTGASTDPHRITLAVDHRFHFAKGRTDWGRVEVFTQDPSKSLAGATPLVPIRLAHQALPDPGSAFAGEGPELREVLYDLTRWAGNDVWIAFHARTQGEPNPGALFRDPARFNLSIPFVGWMIDNVRVDGPAHPHNVRIDQVLYPRFADPTDPSGHTRLAGAGPGQDRFSILALNRGQFTENILGGLSVTALSNGTRWSCDAVESPLRLRPGDAKRAEFDCPFVVEENEAYEATFDLAPAASVTDMYPSDNHLTIKVEGRRGTTLTGDPLDLDHRLGGPNQDRLLTASVRNSGFSSETARLSLIVELNMGRPGEADEWEDVTVNETVAFLIDSPSPDRTVQLDADPFAERAPTKAVWRFRLLVPGQYRLTVEGYVGSRLEWKAEANAGVLMAPSLLYQSDFKSEEEVGEILAGPVGSEWRTWTTRSLIDSKPPAYEDGRVQDFVWEFPSNGARPFGAWASVLRGEIDVREMPRGATYTDLKVTVIHSFRDLRCAVNSPRDCGRDAFGTPGIGPALIRISRLAPQAWAFAPEPTSGGLSVPNAIATAIASAGGNLAVDGVVLQRINWDRANAFGRFQNSHSYNRFAFLSGQWTAETFQISLGPDGIPGEALAGLNLEFYIAFPGIACPPPAGKLNQECPAWRIASAEVVGLTTPSPDVKETPLIRTRGFTDANARIDDELGTWNSYTMHTLQNAGTQFCTGNLNANSFQHPNQLRCPFWVRRDLSALVPPASAWKRHERIENFTAADGVWTMVSDPTTLIYEDGQRDILVSPALRIPKSAQVPTVQFDHVFRFLKTYTAAAETPHYQDGGMLMVRFVEQDGGTLRPSSPFLPIAIQYVPQAANQPPANGLPPIAHKFMEDDCAYYQLGHPDPACSTKPLRNRAMVSHSLVLTNLPVLNYTKLRMGSGQDGTYLLNPDLAALEILNLREYCGLQECIVQFGFIAETISGLLREAYPGGGQSDFRATKQTARNAIVGGVANPGEGWFISNFRVTSESAFAHNLLLENLQIKTPYNWTALGLGPDTDAVAVFTVRNHGLFPAQGFLLNLTLQNVEDPSLENYVEIPAPPDLVLERFQVADVEIPFRLPSRQGAYRLLATIKMVGELRPGLPLVDEDTRNNCASIDASADFRPGVCSIASAPPLRVVASPHLAVDFNINPEAGRAGFHRALQVRLTNSGNVIVRGPELRILIQSIDDPGERPVDVTWKILSSPAPGANATWERLELVHPTTGQPASPQATIVLDQPGRYIALATLVTEGGAVFDQRFIDAFETFYADDFEPKGLSLNPKMVDGTELKPTGQWSKVNELSFGRGRHSWHFGNLSRGNYADRANDTLELPPLDLSTASLGRLSFAHRYDLEQGYDGGRVEASLDDGQTWVPITPRQPYPQTVLADNPLNPNRDPTSPARAFTGDSRDEFPVTDGWTISEFDLGQIPGLTTPVSVQTFSTAGFDNTITNNVDRIHYSDSWSLPGKGCLTYCWYEENLNERFPPLNPGSTPAINPSAAAAPLPPGLATDSKYWWSGTLGQAVLGTDTIFSEAKATLTLDLQVPTPNAGQLVRLSYWEWKDDSGKGTAGADVNGQRNLAVIGADGTTTQVQPIQSHSDPITGWTNYLLPLTNFQGQAIQVRFRYSEIARAIDDQSNRGLVLDDILIETYVQDALGRDTLLARSGFPNTQAGWTPNPATVLGWRTVERVPDTPSNWTVRTEVNRRGEVDGRVWWFGQIDATQKFNYPANAHDRLVTPRISLKAIGGDTAQLSLWEHYELAAGDRRRLQVQALEPNLAGEQWGPWVTIFEDPVNPAYRTSDQPECERTKDWCHRGVAISDFIGKDVRFAFEIETTRKNPASVGSFGYHWALDEIGINAESMAGEQLRLRLRAGTDGTLNGEGWTIDNLQVVGRQYKNNVAVLVKGDSTEQNVSPGTRIDFHGTVRNLGAQGAQQDLFLALETSGIERLGRKPPDDPETMQITFTDISEGRLPIPTPVGPAGPFHLFSPSASNTRGERLDRLPFQVSLTVPVDAQEQDQYAISLALYQRDPATGAIQRIKDENLGDHDRTILVGVESSAGIDWIDRRVYPPTVEGGRAVDFDLTVTNTGTLASQASARFEVIEVASGQLRASISTPTVTLKAQGTNVLHGTWQAQGEGLFRVRANLSKLLSGLPEPVTEEFPVGHVLVDQHPIFFTENFEGNVSQWTPTTAAPHSGGAACPPITTMAVPDARSQWRPYDERAFDGARSFYLGANASDAILNGATYSPNRDEALRSPLIDLTLLGDINSVPNSPFEPFLAFRYFSMLGSNDGLVVQAARLSDVEESFSLTQAAAIPGRPGKAETGVVPCKNPLSSASVLPPLGAGAQRAVVTGNEEAWHVAEYSLAGDVLYRGPGLFEPLLGNEVWFVPRFASDNNGQGTGFAIDSLSVSSYDVDVRPAQQIATLRTGADKVFYVRVENTGAASDTYQVAIDPSATNLPRKGYLRTQVLTPTLELAPGERANAAIRVYVDSPDVRNLTFESGLSVGILVASTFDPNRIAQSIIQIDQFQPSHLPDLVTRLGRPAGESGPVTEGEPISYLVTVANEGAAPSRRTDVVVLACPDHGDIIADLAACLNAHRTGQPTESRPYLLATSVIPTLPSPANAADLTRTRFTLTVTWVPPLGSRGTYHILTLPDTEGINEQYDRRNDIARSALRVDPIERPDLSIVSLAVYHDAEGTSPVHQSFAGDVLRIVGVVENRGIADARDVSLRLVNQFPLFEQALPLMAPGQSVTLTTQWIASPGNWAILLEASTSTPETDPTNNLATWPIGVRQGSVTATFDPPLLHAEPGQEQFLLVRVHNRRAVSADVFFRVRTPEGIMLAGLPDRLTLPRGAVKELPASVLVSPFVTAGNALARVELSALPNGPAFVGAELNLQWGQERRLGLEADPILLAPGRHSIMVRITNAGGGPELVTLTTEAPPGWGAVARVTRLQVGPGETAKAEIDLETPAQVSPGLYELPLRNGVDTLGSLTVRVVEGTAWQSVIESVRRLDGRTDAWVRVTNTGNIKGVPDFSAEVLDGSALVSVEPSTAELASGETGLFRISFTGETATVNIRLPGDAVTRPVDVENVETRIEALRLEATSGGDLRSGDMARFRFHIRNAGQGMERDLPVRVFLDGRLVNEQRVSLEAGEVREVTFEVRSPAGNHVIVAAAGDPERGGARALPLSVESSHEAPSVAAAAMLLGLALVALVGRWRRGP